MLIRLGEQGTEKRIRKWPRSVSR